MASCFFGLLLAGFLLFEQSPLIVHHQRLNMWITVNAPQSLPRALFNSLDEPWEIGERFQRRAASYRMDAFWEQGELLEEVEFLSKQCRLAVIVDRRVDPNQLMTLRVRQLTLEQALWQVGQHDQLAVAILPNQFYLGPPHTAVALPELLRELEQQIRLSRIDDHAKRVLLQHRPMDSGNELVIPREWIERWSRESGIAIDGLERVPFDLWPPLDRPAVPMYQHLALMLAGFDLWLAVGNQGLPQVVEFPKRESWRKVLGPMPSTPELQRRLRAEFPDLRVAIERGALVLEGTADDIAAGTRVAMGWSPAPPANDAKSTFNLKTRGSRLAILTAIADQTDRQLQVDEPTLAAMQQVVEIDAVEVTLDELIRLVLDNSGARFEMTPNLLRVFSR
ncbi:MAG TPA: hypothetical protein PKD54_08915 [Pirellulaceae bacterium]|nr:hypothetical protein [Pirellulaceae bacterium]